MCSHWKFYISCTFSKLYCSRVEILRLGISSYTTTVKFSYILWYSQLYACRPGHDEAHTAAVWCGGRSLFVSQIIILRLASLPNVRLVSQCGPVLAWPGPGHYGRVCVRGQRTAELEDRTDCTVLYPVACQQCQHVTGGTHNTPHLTVTIRAAQHNTDRVIHLINWTSILCWLMLARSMLLSIRHNSSGPEMCQSQTSALPCGLRSSLYSKFGNWFLNEYLSLSLISDYFLKVCLVLLVIRKYLKVQLKVVRRVRKIMKWH